MTNHSEHPGLRRQLLVMAACLLGAMVLLVGLLPPQAARGQEQQEQHPTPPPQWAQGNEQEQEKQQQNAAPPADSNGTQQKQVLDKDPQGNEVVAGELLVSYKRDASKEAKDEASKGSGGRVKKDFRGIDVQLFSFPEVKNERAQQARQQALQRRKEALEKNPNVEAAEYNNVIKPAMTPTDPLYNKQWAFPKINAPGAWDTTQGSGSVKVAVIDTGIASDHPDLQNKIVAQYDFANEDNQAEETSGEYRGHGTHVAGTIAASTNNGAGVAGTCPNCKLLIAKYWDETYVGTKDTMVSAINWSVAQGAKVINMSFGDTTYSEAQERAVKDAWAKGVVLVGAAGNDGRDDLKMYPAAYDNVIAVAATSSVDERTFFSNAGSWVDVAAPGINIYSTVDGWWWNPTDTEEWYYYEGYNYNSGTSMAAPHVSGLAGLILSKDASLSNAQVRYQIESTAKDLGAAGKDPEYGSGRIDAQAALKFTSRTHQENDTAIAYSGSDWTKYSWSGAWGSASGGYTNWASRAGATATFTFTGNSVTWWANRGDYGGRAHVYVDGVQQSPIVYLWASANQPSQPVFTKSWPSTGTHTIKIQVMDVPYRPWVDVDRFTVTQRT